MKYVLILMLLLSVACSRESRTNDNAFDADAVASSNESSFADGQWSYYSNSATGINASDLIIQNGRFSFTHYWYQSGGMAKRVVSGTIRKTSEGIDLVASSPSCFSGRIYSMVISGINKSTDQRLFVGHQSALDQFIKGLGPGYPSAVEVDACLYAEKHADKSRMPASMKVKNK